MKTVIKTFNELTTKELFDILKLRIDVFVVEQKCAYPDIDEYDLKATHVYFEEDGKIQAYLRILPCHTLFDEVSIGRVIAVKRRCGLGSAIIKQGIQTAKEKHHMKQIKIEAQVYAKKLYEKQGFVQISEPFLEDGIPHVLMMLDL